MIWGKEKDNCCGFSDFHRWFAWHPVRIEDGRWAWLCFVEGASLTEFSNGLFFTSTSYRLIKKTADSEPKTMSST